MKLGEILRTVLLCNSIKTFHHMQTPALPNASSHHSRVQYAWYFGTLITY